MERRLFLMGLLGSGIVVACSSHAGTGNVAVPSPSAKEQRATIAALKPPKRRRPLIAVLADNRGSETTDLMVPYSVLTRSGIADVTVVAPDASPISLMPALTIRPQSTLAAVDKAHPDGADYVIVPAFHHDDRKGPILDWLRRQAASGSTVIGICEGARVLGRAGLLDGKRATTHWYAASSLRRAHPAMEWVRDRRYVADRGVVTTTGVSASIPVSLALVEAIAGAGAAARLAEHLGSDDHDAAHDSNRFGLNAGWVSLVAGNSLAFWGHETIGLPVSNGIDDIALALTADAWSRTYRSKAVTTGEEEFVTTRDGLTLQVDRKAQGRPVDFALPVLGKNHPAQSLDTALSGIAARHGAGTARLVALQLEYLWEGRG